MEGIFAMYCAAYLIDPESGKSKTKIQNFINDLRIDTQLGELIGQGLKSVDYSNMFPGKLGTSKKRFGNDLTIISGKEAKLRIKDSPKVASMSKVLKDGQKFFESIGTKGYIDFSQVELKVRVKEAETGLYYGRNLKKLIEEEQKKGSVKDAKYNSIKKKMINLLENRQSQFFNDLRKAKEKYLKNGKNDVVQWTVDADGIGGETSGGEIKQDVTIQIFADGRRILRSELNFSLKSDSVSVHSGGIYNSLPEIYDMFKGVVPSSKLNEGEKYMKLVAGKGTTVSRKESVDALWKLIGHSLPKQPNIKWSDHFWSILEKRLFGTGYRGKIQLLEMNQNELREISKSNFEKLKNSGVKLYPQWYEASSNAASPGDIRIMPLYKGKIKETKESNFVFKIRILYIKQKIGQDRTGPAYPNKVLIDLGGKGSIVHDENWNSFMERGLV